MNGPKEKGFWSHIIAPNMGSQYGILQVRKAYRVKKEFVDHNASLHPVGEEWIFLGYSYLPYDSGL